MRTVAVIPARYESSRLRGKPLADICGRPMIWWVHHQIAKSQKIAAVYVATDHEEIRRACEEYGIAAIMTFSGYRSSTVRIYEAA